MWMKHSKAITIANVLNVDPLAGKFLRWRVPNPRLIFKFLGKDE